MASNNSTNNVVFLDAPWLTLTASLLMQVNAPLPYHQLPLSQEFFTSWYSSHCWRAPLNSIYQTVTKQNQILFHMYLVSGAWKWMNFLCSSLSFLALSLMMLMECQSLVFLGTASSTLDSTIISWATSLWHNKHKQRQEIKIKSNNVFTQVPQVAKQGNRKLITYGMLAGLVPNRYFFFQAASVLSVLRD